MSGPIGHDPRVVRGSVSGPVPAATPRVRPAQGHTTVSPETPLDFRTILERERARGATAPLKFSAHAQARLQAAGIHISPQDATRLQQAVERAGAKGARQSLILLDGTAFLVSVKNRTVITAIEESRAKENVFTNIDSAVIA